MNQLLLLLSLAATQPDPALLTCLEYRQLHLTRGGRSTAVTGVAADPLESAKSMPARPRVIGSNRSRARRAPGCRLGAPQSSDP